MKVVTVEEMRRLEQRAEAAGVPAEKLMERAGRAVAMAVRDELQGAAGRHVVVLVGPGNNGGDGLVAARYLARWGANVTAFVPVERREPDVLAATAEEFGCDVLTAHLDPDGSVFGERIGRADLIIDALLGTGGGRPLEGPIADALSRVRGATASIVAVDLPSGVDADTGAIDARAVPADLTVVLGAPKLGLFHPGSARTSGRLMLADIGLPEDQGDARIELIDSAFVREVLPARTLGDHKGSFGRVLIVGGSRNYVGAPVLAARGAARIGAGLVTLATPASISGRVATMMPEATHRPIREGGHPDDAGLEDSPTVAELADASGAMLVGPGLGLGAGARGLVEEVFRRPGSAHFGPIVLDADALNALAERDGWHVGLASPATVTPHPGEMARLTGMTVAEIQDDRVGAARNGAAKWAVTVVLKGAFTVVAEPDGRVAINPSALPVLGSAGTGDVLAGAITGLLAQGVPPYEAACAAVYLHCAAGMLAARSNGDPTAGLLAGEVAENLPAAMGVARRGERVAGMFI